MKDIDHEHTSDRALMIRVASGDRMALGELYDRYGTALLALGQRMLGTTAEAEDLIHDVFVEAWQLAGQYDASRGTVRAWLVVRMRSRCLDRLRAPARRRWADPETAGMDAIAAEEAAADSALASGSRLQEALAKLPEMQRQVLVLGYFEGLSSSEIAGKLQIPIGTVKSRVAAAMRTLRQALTADAPTEEV